MSSILRQPLDLEEVSIRISDLIGTDIAGLNLTDRKNEARIVENYITLFPYFSALAATYEDRTAVAAAVREVVRRKASVFPVLQAGWVEAIQGEIEPARFENILGVMNAITRVMPGFAVGDTGKAFAVEIADISRNSSRNTQAISIFSDVMGLSGQHDRAVDVLARLTAKGVIDFDLVEIDRFGISNHVRTSRAASAFAEACDYRSRGKIVTWDGRIKNDPFPTASASWGKVGGQYQALAAKLG